METARHRSSWGSALLRFAKPVAVAVAVVSLLKLFALEAYRIPSASMEDTLLPGDFVLVNKLTFGLRLPKRVPLLGWEVPALGALGGRSVRRGDVIVFEFTKDIEGTTLPRGSKLVKRVVGIPGDTVHVDELGVRVNGQALRIGSSAAPVSGGSGRRTHARVGPVVVPSKGDVIRLAGDRLDEDLRIIEAEGHAVARDGGGNVLIDGRPAKSFTLGCDYYYVLGDNLHNSYDSRWWGFVSERDLIGEVIMVYWSWHQGSDALAAFSSIRWGRIGSVVR